MIASKLQQQNVGYPLLDRLTRCASRHWRSLLLSGCSKLPGMPGTDRLCRSERSPDEFESTVASFWRAPFTGPDVEPGLWPQTMTLFVNKAIKLGYNKMSGRPHLQKWLRRCLRRYMSLGMLLTLRSSSSTNQIIGNGPIDKERRKVWEESLAAWPEAQQHPWRPTAAGVPIAHTLFLMNDIVDMAGNQWNNGLDTNDLMWDGISLLANQVMRCRASSR